MLMLVYSLALILGLAGAAPWWGWRMLTSGRYREGLAGRLGRVPAALHAACAGKRVVWVHAVSVGEVLAVARLVAELRAALGSGWVVALSTTTATGQKIARERLGAATVFWFPLDFGFAVRAYLRVLKPELLVLVESELWPRVLWECERAGVPVAVVNARVSDRSFQRTMRVRGLWLKMARRVTVWLAQGEETAGRLLELGVVADRVRVPGNLKYDLAKGENSGVADWIFGLAAGRPVIVAGSTLPGRQQDGRSEEELVIRAWESGLCKQDGALLVLAPRHPARFDEVFATASEFKAVRASARGEAAKSTPPFANSAKDGPPGVVGPDVVVADVVVLDTLGDLAAVYGVADSVFVGGSLVAKGGHNPLEAARFGVSVVMGPSYENFREIVDGMRTADAIRIADADGLADALAWALRDGKAMGERGRKFFEARAGATGRTVAALLELLRA